MTSLSITYPTTDEFFDAVSSIFKPSFASNETSISSYKTERTINSRKSRYNVLPQHKYAGIEYLWPPRGPVSLDAGRAPVLEVCRTTIRCPDSHTCTSVKFQTELRDEATQTMEAHQSGPQLIPEYEVTIDDIIQADGRSVHQWEAGSFLLTK